MSLSGIFARMVALIGAAMILLRRRDGRVDAQALGDTPAIPAAKPQGYIGVGSLTNIADSGMAIEEGRAAIYELDLTSGTSRIFASGLRNPVGMAWEPKSGALWTVVNERDGLYGRPVGVAIGPDRCLLVADDVGDVIWRVTGRSHG